MKKEWIFSYGTLQDPDIQKELFGGICPKTRARLSGWALYVSLESGYLFIKPEPSGSVKGFILEVDSHGLHSADQWEEVPIYQREKVWVTLDDATSRQVWTYTRRDTEGESFAGPQLSANDRNMVLKAVKGINRQKKRSDSDR